MKLNNYLKELGLTWYDLPGNYIPKTSFKIRLRRRWYRIKRSICIAFGPLEDKIPDFREEYEYEAYDIRNREDNQGFCESEFWSLDHSMALYIYPRLCKFRDEYAKCGTPSCFCYDENGEQYANDYDSNGEWIKCLDKMCLAFKYIIKEPYNMEWKEINDTIQEGLDLFAKYYLDLWW